MVEILSVSNSGLGFRAPRRAHLYSRSFSTSQRKISLVAASEKNRDQERLVIAPCVGSSPSFIFTAATNLSTARKKHVPPLGQPRRPQLRGRRALNKTRTTPPDAAPHDVDCVWSVIL